MRLIDADKLKKEIHCSYSDDLEILEKIENQPTAFELKNVIKQLEILRVKTTEDSCPGAECERCVYSDICKDVSCADVHALDSAIEIVKKGGRDEE